MPELKLFWLGFPAVEVNGKPVEPEMRKATALLAYLSLGRGSGRVPSGCWRPGAAQPREVLATLFWPEYDQQHALANLRRTLASLRGSLGGGWLEADRETVRLKDGTRLWMDVEEFRGRLTAAGKHTHPTEAPCADCLASLEEAVALYRGDFLEGLNLPDCPDFDEWQFLEREDVRRELGTALQRLVQGYAMRGDLERALSHARRWVALDRLHEPAQRTLMDLYSRAGQRSAALHQYEECARLLKGELDRPPETETTQLYEQIRSARHDGEAAEQSAAQPATPAKEITAPTPLPLLKTKLFIPQAHPDTLPRARLVSRLEEGMQRPLTLISAPAGFGKTTLLAEWVSRSTLPVCWVSLDPADNEPTRFLSYLILALGKLQPGVGAEALSVLRSVRPLPLSLVVTLLLSDLESIDEPFVLILDDHQFITFQPLHDALASMLDHLPPQMHLVLATRADPSLPLARLRARGQLLEIRADDLRFTYEEAAQFLHGVMGLELASGDIDRLEERTEGWIVGLQMAALSMQGREDTSAFIEAFSGSHRHVLDYLTEEVLNGQPEVVQAFLLETSILERLSAPLCEAISGQSRSECQQRLEDLERSNLFLVPLDDRREWYRYHHLFADLLQARLQRSWPTPRGHPAAELHARAADWYERNGLYSDAIAHSLAAGDVEGAARRIEQAAPAVMVPGEYATMLSWIDALPEQMVRERPWLCLHKAGVFALTGHPDNCEPLLQMAERFVSPGDGSPEAREILGYAASIRVAAAGMKGELERTIELAHGALELLPEKDPLARNVVVQISLGTACFLLGQVAQAGEAYAEAARLARMADNIFGVLASTFEIAKARRLQGRLREAYDLLCTSLQLASDRGWSRAGVNQMKIAMGDLLREWNNLEAAQHHFIDGLRSGGKSGLPQPMISANIGLARLMVARGDLRGADEALQEAERLVRKYNASEELSSQAEATRVGLWLVSGQLEEAGRWARERGPFPRDEHVFSNEVRHIALARVLIARGEHDQAEALVARLAEAAETGGRFDSLIRILALQALALEAQGKTGRALAMLGKSLSLAEPEGYVRTFVDEGVPMQRLLRRGVELGEWRRTALEAYARKLLAAFGRGEEKNTPGADSIPGQAGSVVTSTGLVEPLSLRELEVLRLMSTGLTNQGIAEKLVVAVGTVKAHTHSIYGKLNAGNRIEALARARELSLL